jgi:hypothetical protein
MMSKVFTANRIAAACTWMTGLAAFIIGIAGTLPTAWANYALIGAGVLTKLVTAIHFMSGSQKYDQIQGAVPPRTALVPVQTELEP